MFNNSALLLETRIYLTPEKQKQIRIFNNTALLLETRIYLAPEKQLEPPQKPSFCVVKKGKVLANE